MWPFILALLTIPLFCSLGVWQYHRAQWKKQLLENYAQRQHQTPLSIDDINNASNIKDKEFYPINISGFLDTEHELLVENKFYQHQLGYEVLTPLVLVDGRVVLVNRGWVGKSVPHDKPSPAPSGHPLPREREKSFGSLTVPHDKPSSSEHVEDHPLDVILSTRSVRRGSTGEDTLLNGIIHTLPNKIFQLGQIPATNTWPKYIQNSSWAEINRALPNKKLYPFIIVLDAKSPQSFTPIYKPTIMPPEKHMGYAFQWFAMALAMLIIALTWGVKSCKIEKP